MLDLCERVRAMTGTNVTYVWFDTGLEFRATKTHLEYLEERYGIEILRRRAAKSIPACVREYGQPFLNKYVSMHLERMQRHGFQWEDEPYEALAEKYEGITATLKWWTNGWTRTGSPGFFDIGRHKLLKEFIIENPPWFKVSNKCCTWAKKKVSTSVARELGADVVLTGIRRSEGSTRSAIKKCFSKGDKGFDTYRPILWFTNDDKRMYEQLFGIRHSDCYTAWGFSRTGCVGCPYNRSVDVELDIAERFEPRISRAARKVFADAYEYTRLFHQYRDSHMTGQMSLDLRHAR